jgi:hypothetical protein
MRGKKAKRLRREAKAAGRVHTPTPNPQKEPGLSRAQRRMKKFQPDRYADLELEGDQRARVIKARRWNWVYSAARPLPKERSPKTGIKDHELQEVE